jgi:hypothetical protein
LHDIVACERRICLACPLHSRGFRVLAASSSALLSDYERRRHRRWCGDSSGIVLVAAVSIAAAALQGCRTVQAASTVRQHGAYVAAGGAASALPLARECAEPSGTAHSLCTFCTLSTAPSGSSFPTRPALQCMCCQILFFCIRVLRSAAAARADVPEKCACEVNQASRS